MQLSARIQHYLDQSEIGIVIDSDQINACALNATTQYAGYADLIADCSIVSDPLHDSLWIDDPARPITLETCITDSEWAIIEPLFDLYVRHENAVFLEASRNLGVDVYGESVSELTQQITAYLEGLPAKAFYYEVITI